MNRHQTAINLALSALAGLVVLVVVLWVNQTENLRYRATLRTLAVERAAALRARLEQTVYKAVSPIESLTALVRNDPDMSRADFDVFAQAVLREYGFLISFQLSPDAVIEYVYPMAGNEGVVGLDLRSLPGQKDVVEQTIGQRQMVLAGPLELVQGGLALVGRHPIFVPNLSGNGDFFWGFATAIVDFAAFATAAGWRDEAAGLRFALRGKDGTGATGEAFLGDSSVFESDPVTSDVAIPNGSWQLAAVPVRGWDVGRPGETISLVLGGLLAAFVALGAGLLARLWFEQKKVEGELRAANEAKREFLARMSHELRTPLNAIIGFSEAMIHEVLGPHSNPRYKEYAADIRDSGIHLLEMVNTILDLDKVEAGKYDLRLEDIELSDLVSTTVRVVAERAAKAGLTLVTDIPPGLPTLRADQRAMKQIILNLLSNSIKFTRKGGRIFLDARIDSAGCMVMVIADTGIGIAPEKIEVALSEFGQVDSPLGRRHHGTGLGLPLAKWLVEMQQGTFELKSEVGVGTKVILRFPADAVGPPCEPETAT